MAVRRLHSDQPASFKFTDENLAWARSIIQHYPEGKQASAVIPILWRAQEQNGGWISEPAISYVAALLDMASIRVYEIATFYTMFQLQPVGKRAHIQVCGTTPCMLRGSGGLLGVCRERIAGHAHQLSEDGNFSWEEVECLGSCANAPLVQIGKDTYEDLTPDSLQKLIDAIEMGRAPKPGSQTGRKSSCPKGGATTLTDPALYDGTLNRHWLKRFPELAGGSAASLSNAPAATQAAVPPMHPAAAAMIANAGLAPDLEKRSGGKPLSVDEIERLKPGGTRAGMGVAGSSVVFGAESSGDMEKPETLTAPRGKPDDLKLVIGIGPKLEGALNKLGIYHFNQIAAWTARNIKWIDNELEDFRGRAVREKWVDQAQRLAAGRTAGPASDSGKK